MTLGNPDTVQSEPCSQANGHLSRTAGLGQLLPAFVTSENPAGDAIGLDIEVLTEA
jgi:hypothetical protein